MLVIACNTASTVALETVRSAIAIPVVGVVPAIKPAAKHTRTGTIALLATPATVLRPYTKKLVADFADGCTVLMKGSSLLVEIAERKLRGQGVSAAELAGELAPLFAQPGGDRIDTIVLGCTHFPLLKNELVALRPDVFWIDSGPAIAARVRSLLGAHSGDRHGNEERGAALFTAMTPEAKLLEKTLADYGFSPLEFFKI